MSDSPQFIRTDKAIMQAFISLLNEKSFEKITVQDILEEAPVTRATFYAHYRDKYEIAERMLAHYFLCAGESAAAPFVCPSPPAAMNNGIRVNREFIRALLKIHTEKVDFRRALAAGLEQEYMAGSDSPRREIEAKIYAQAYTELYLSCLEQEHPDLSPENTRQILIPVVMKLLRLSGDQETLRFLTRKTEHSPA